MSPGASLTFPDAPVRAAGISVVIAIPFATVEAHTVHFDSYLQSTHADIEAALQELLPAGDVVPHSLHSAMRHSMFAGGKRLRPILTVAACEACGGDRAAAIPAGCAVECIHTYSLIHDDLPCMDNDDFRRGRPTCHKVYGEAVALLAGDAFQPLAFEILLRSRPGKCYGLADLVRELAEAAGSRWLVGGQVQDLEGEGRKLSLEKLRAIHEGKTMAMMTAALRLGGMCGGASGDQLEGLTRFGRALGLAFQVIDDILDVTQTSEKLGKTAGKDEKAEKSTYPSVLGLEESRAEAHRLTDEALEAIAVFEENGQRLAELAHHLLDREY